MDNLTKRFRPEGYFDEQLLGALDLGSYMQSISVPDLRVTRCIFQSDGIYEAAQWLVPVTRPCEFSYHRGTMNTNGLTEAIKSLHTAFCKVGFEQLEFYEPDYENEETVGLTLRVSSELFVCRNYDRTLFEDMGVNEDVGTSYLLCFDRVLKFLRDPLLSILL